MKNTNIFTKIVTKTWQRKTDKMPGTKKRRSHYRCNHYHHHRCLCRYHHHHPPHHCHNHLQHHLPAPWNVKENLVHSSCFQDLDKMLKNLKGHMTQLQHGGRKRKNVNYEVGKKQHRGAIYRCSGLGLDGW